MTQIPRKIEAKNPDGQYKSIAQLMKSQLTVRQYGQVLAMAAKKES